MENSFVKASANMSCVWYNFDVNQEDASNSICVICEGKFSRGGNDIKNYTTTNFISHLQLKHPRIHKNFSEMDYLLSNERKSNNLNNDRKQIKLDNFFERKSYWKHDHPTAIRITKLIADMII